MDAVDVKARSPVRSDKRQHTAARDEEKERERKKASLLINSLLCFPRVVMIFCSICSGLFDVAVRLAKLELDAV